MKAIPQNAERFYRERDRHTTIDSEVAKIVSLELYKLGPGPNPFKISECQLGASGPNLYSADIIDFIVEGGCAGRWRNTYCSVEVWR